MDKAITANEVGIVRQTVVSSIVSELLLSVVTPKESLFHGPHGTINFYKHVYLCAYLICALPEEVESSRSILRTVVNLRSHSGETVG